MKAELMTTANESSDPNIKLLHSLENISYEQLTWYHGGCPGYTNDTKIAKCLSHPKVKSVEVPQHYISK
jgi:hypothetical protein